MQPYSVVAHNTATASANRIHDDEVATSLGFRGGLVPGVDVYAYLTQAPVAVWGRAWLERGTIAARFEHPVYDGDVVDVGPDPEAPADGDTDEGEIRLLLTGPSGRVCARAAAGLPTIAPPVAAEAWPGTRAPLEPPEASPTSLAPGTVLHLAERRFVAARAGEYLDAVREVHPIYRDERVAHPGWILRDANHVLSANVRLGPWIHVSSTVQHQGVVRDGEAMSARAVVQEEWERKGHRFVRLDVLHLADGRPVARTDHVAIYRPRGT